MIVGKMKKINMYQVEFDEITPDERKMISDYGRKVITDEQYFEIGAIKALQNFVDQNKPVKKSKRKK